MGGCAPIYHARWHVSFVFWGLRCGRVMRTILVSRFLVNPIQMNFAENQKWPTNVEWRGRPTRVVGGSMRAGNTTESGQPDKATAPALQRIISDRQPICDFSSGLEEFLAQQRHRIGSRLLRNRSLRLHGVLELLGCVMGPGLLALKNGFCG